MDSLHTELTGYFSVVECTASRLPLLCMNPVLLSLAKYIWTISSLCRSFLIKIWENKSSIMAYVFVNIRCNIKLKKVGKTTRPFRYNLNQLPYDYTVKVKSGFKGLYLIHRVHEELWTRYITLYRRQR